MKTLNRRMTKLEGGSAGSGPVYIAVGPNDDKDELLHKRFGEDGPATSVSVVFVHTGVPRL
jgi:hypothetical protein